jgi:hypothetical protein
LFQVLRNLLLTKNALKFLLIGKLPHREFAVVVLFKVGYDKKACVSEFDGDGSHEQDENDYSHDDDNQSEDGFQNFFNP